jgi:hypothetical protein
MLTILASLLTAAAASAVEIIVAPDQPAPYLYAGEPLVLELRAPSTMRVGLSATTQGPRGETREMNWGTLTLNAGEPRWVTWADFPEAIGVYSLTITFADEAGAIERTVGRIPRHPSGAPALPVAVDARGASIEELFAVRAAGLTRVRLGGNSPDADKRIARAQEMGFSVVIAFDSNGPLPDARVLQAMAGKERGLSTWEVALGSDVGAFRQKVLALRRAAPRVPVIASIGTVDDALRLFGEKIGGLCDGVSVMQHGASFATLSEIRNVAEACGYEGLRYSSIRPSGQTAAPAETSAVEDYLAGMASGFSTTMPDSRKLVAGREFSNEFIPFAALIRQAGDARYLGQFFEDGGARIHVFRDVAFPDGWFVVIFDRGEAGPSSSTFEGATVIGVASSLGDPLPLEGNVIPIELDETGNRLLFARGRGGEVLLRAVESSIRREARGLLAVANHEAILSPDIVKALRQWSEPSDLQSDRFRFLTLIRAFPKLEEQWHSGVIQQALAVRLMAGMSRLARRLAVVEHEAGDAFLEPLQETLARCGEYQSLYLTSTGGAVDARERGDWLLEEVNALTAEARQLAKRGRAIEADAVAAIAEWRARALSHASKAKPLGHYDAPAP